MGVKGLWKLLAPVGRRVSLESLEGKVLAVDISVWITQFIKAMRDEEGNMTVQAHIIGTLRRILKLLFNRIRPVFVFDGQTPMIKRNTTAMRRKFRERGDHDKRALARKILLSQLKQNALRKSLGDTGAISSRFVPLRSKQAEKRLLKDPFVSNILAIEGGATAGTGATPTLRTDDNAISRRSHSDSDNDNDSDVQWEGGFDNLPPPKRLAADSDQNGPDYNDDVEGEEAAWVMPENTYEMDVEVLAALPVSVRRSIIEEAERADRSKRLNSLIPVAADPNLYSQTQLAHFLNRSKLNNKLLESEKLHRERDAAAIDGKLIIKGTVIDGGKRLAAEANKKYILLQEKSLSNNNKGSNISSNNNSNSTMSDASSSSGAVISAVESSSSSSSASPPSLSSPHGFISASQLPAARVAAATSTSESIFTSICSSVDSAFVTVVEDEDLDEAIEGCGNPNYNKGNDNLENHQDDEERFEFHGDSDCEWVSEDSISNCDSVCLPHESNDSLPTYSDFSYSHYISDDTRSNVSTRNSIIGDGVSSQAQFSANVPTANTAAVPSTDDSGNSTAVTGIAETGIAAMPITVAGGTTAGIAIAKGSSANAVTAELLSRAVGTAHSMTDWAGRVVERTLKQHLQQHQQVSINSEAATAADAIASLESNHDVNNNNNNNSNSTVSSSYIRPSPSPSPSLLSPSPLAAALFTAVDPCIVSEYELMTAMEASEHQQQQLLQQQAGINNNNNNIIYLDDTQRDTDDDIRSGAIVDLTTTKATDDATSIGMELKRKHSSVHFWDEDDGVRYVSGSSEDEDESSSDAEVYPASNNSSRDITGSVGSTDNNISSGSSSSNNNMHSNTTSNSSSIKSPPKIADVEVQRSAAAAAAAAEPETLMNLLANEQSIESALRKDRMRSSRDAETMTEEMKEEIMALLNAFGLPFIVAPFEAEAQCAALEQLGLVDGIVTEDSDAFLFGAQRVYRNIFNDQKYVEVYDANDVRKEIGVDRESFVALAYFLGSDYTPGVRGIGIVNAMEILQTFPMSRTRDSEGLKKQRQQNECAEEDAVEDEDEEMVGGDDQEKGKGKGSGALRGLRLFKSWIDGYDICEELQLVSNKNKNKIKNKNSCDNKLERNNDNTRSSRSKKKTRSNNNNSDSNSDNSNINRDDAHAAIADDNESDFIVDGTGKVGNSNNRSNKNKRKANQSLSAASNKSIKSSKRPMRRGRNRKDDFIDTSSEEEQSVAEDQKLQQHRQQQSKDDSSDSVIVATDARVATVADMVTAAAGSSDEEDATANTESSSLALFTAKHASGRASWKLPPNFPDPLVADAYFYAKVNDSTAPFVFEVPQLYRVKKYCSEVLGWTELQLDSNIDPVIRRFVQGLPSATGASTGGNMIQKRMESYMVSYSDDARFAKVWSKRLSSAMVGLTGKAVKLIADRNQNSNTKGTVSKRSKQKEKKN